jgi:hypothetical protein
MRGVQMHSLSLHQWRVDTSVQTHEHDVAVMLFCMDSAIECFVFMLNALGQAVESGPRCQDHFPAAIRLWIGGSEIGR